MNTLAFTTAQSATHIPEAFQRKVVDNMAEALLRHPSPPCLLRAPTGSGKTFMLTGVLERVSAAKPTLWFWFVPFVNLVQQTEDAILANASGLAPTLLARGRNQQPQSGMVLLSTAQGVARARDRKAGYAGDGDDDYNTLVELKALSRARGLNIGLVVDEAHIGLDHGTEFGQFAHWLEPDYLVMASATPKDARLDEFLVKSGKGAREAFTVSRSEVVEARLNKRYIEAVVYKLQHGISTVLDLKRTVLRQAWLRHERLKHDLHGHGVDLVPLLLVQVGNGDKAVEEAEQDLMQMCRVAPSKIGKHSADEPDPVLMAAIANDRSKEVLIFKQSAGTGFDAPRAFVLASTKPVNDQDFAMQFIGRVMRVAIPIRRAFPRPMPIPADLDTAFVYLADSEAQQGFEAAVQASQSVKSRLEGESEAMIVRQTVSGASVFTNRTSAQMPVTYDAPPPILQFPTSPTQETKLVELGPQGGLFSTASAAVPVDVGNALMAWDALAPAHSSSVAKRAPSTITEASLIEDMNDNGIRAYRRRTLEALPRSLLREFRPGFEDMSSLSRTVAERLPLSPGLIEIAVRAAFDQLRDTEVHTELTRGVTREEDVAVVTDRAALLREADAVLRRLPQVEDADVRIVVRTLADRLRPFVDAHLAGATESSTEEKHLMRLARDAACWVVRSQQQEIGELLQGMVAEFTTVASAAPLPDAMLFPAQLSLDVSKRNIYGVLPPGDTDLDLVSSVLAIDAQAQLRDAALPHDQGNLTVGKFDGSSTLNGEERDFAKALDRATFVEWWHRNPDRKPYSVHLVRSEHRNYFYPDFVVCLAHSDGETPTARLIETKENVKDAERKARRIPKCYGKVLFVTKDASRLRIVKDDGSLGATFDWNNLAPMRDWLADTRAQTAGRRAEVGD